MKACKYFLIYILLAAFTFSTISSSGFADWFGKSSVDSTMAIEDVEDSADVEDSETEDGIDDSKELGSENHQLSRHNISMIILHQMQIFRSHHPTIITPPPKA